MRCRQKRRKSDAIRGSIHRWAHYLDKSKRQITCQRRWRPRDVPLGRTSMLEWLPALGNAVIGFANGTEARQNHVALGLSVQY